MKRAVARPAQYKGRARTIKALAHPTRLFILDELSRGERSVRELTEMVGVEMPTISRHLGVLKSAGILDDDKRGPQVFYRVRLRCVLKVFGCLKAIERESDRQQTQTLRSYEQTRSCYDR